MVSMHSRENAGLKSFDDYSHTIQRSAKSFLKFGFLNISAIFLLVYSSLFLLDGAGTLLCGKNDFYTILNSANSQQISECPNVLHMDEKTLTKAGKKKKFRFWKKRKNNNQIVNENLELTNEDNSHNNNAFCYSIALALSSVAKIAPTSRYRNFGETTESCPSDEMETKQEPSKSKNPFKRFKKKAKKKTKVNSPTTSYYVDYTDAQIKMAQELASIVKSKFNETDQGLHDRMNAIAWGGPVSEGGSPWWGGKKKGKGIDGDGINLSLSYLRIMDFPKDKKTNFPFELCTKKCTTDVGITHTIEYREKYKPWKMTPSAIKENEAGWIYVHGYSSGYGDEVGPSLIFLRPGLHGMKDEEGYLRAMMNTLDFAVADALKRSDNKYGKYNVLLDSTGFKVANIGGLRQVKRAFRMLKDHFPDRLGHMFFTNLGGPAQLFLRMVSPFIEESVKDKLHVISNDPEKRLEELRPWIADDFIPTWLGGEDTFEFNAKQYYGRSKSLLATDEEGLSYLQTMPYHA